jgi:hypothetical protein
MAAATLLGSALVAAGATGPHGAPALAVPGAVAAGGCTLANGIQHVIYIQFDNTHLTRDRANVPSDLEQMPHLLSFMENNGVVLANHHTPLISHTSEDILTSLTGVYPNRHGVAVGQNSYQFYNSSKSPRPFTTAFTYWTDLIGNGTYNMLSGAPTTAKPTGTNAPAPWVPYTRAGCDVGGVASANQVLENTGSDITTVFGPNSPQAQEASAAFNIPCGFGSNPPCTPAQRKAKNQPQADFVGIGIHCAQTSNLCSSANGGQTDRLPDEPSGYTGYMGLFGAKYVDPQISPSGPLTDLNGNVIADSTGNPGFPGFDGMNAAVSLGYVAAMQEHNIPITYAYISDSHDLQGAPTHTALGPGEQAYVAQLKADDNAFAAFFNRLANDGINKSNTLFVFTADEGDHFTGGQPTTPGCTGATIDNSTNPPTVIPGNYCTYDKTTSLGAPPGPPFGEVAAGLQGLLVNAGTLQNASSYVFTVGNDTAPGVYLNGQPARTDSSARAFEQATAALQVTDPLTNTTENLAQYLADPVEMNILHTITLDPTRTPTFTLFAQPDFYVTATCKGGFNSTSPPVTTNCVLEQPPFAWLHGNVQNDITNTWLGVVGPGVSHPNGGVDTTTWSDHTDIRPTMLALLSLTDDYSHDGRVLSEILDPNVLPHALHAHHETWLRLAQVYKQLNASVGAFGLATLVASTTAVASSSTGDQTYNSIESSLIALGQQRDALAQPIASELDASAFAGQALNEQQAKSQIDQAQSLISQAQALAG